MMNIRNWLYVAGLVVFCVATMAVAAPHGTDASMMALQGMRLSKEEVSQLEEHLQKEPDDLNARTKLLGYYETRQFGPDADRPARTKHVLWVIQNHPEAQIAGLPYASINATLDPKGYDEAKAAWLKAIKEHGGDAMVCGNAAQFFLLSDRQLAEQLLQKAAQLEPAQPRWPDKLGHLYALQSVGKEKSQPGKALEQFERAQKLDDDAMSRFARLDSLAKAAFSADDMTKASKYAQELLKEADSNRADWNYGNAIHHGNIVLGRVALAKGDVKAACDDLIKAGETTGSPVLDSFGPNMSLAKELLEKGEKATVLKYFELCGKFWNSKKLDEWKADVNAGRVPDFGANLVY